MNIILKQDDKIVHKQNPFFAINDRKKHDKQNTKAWSTYALALADDLHAIVEASFWNRTFAVNINKKALTVKVEKGLNSQTEGREQMQILNTFIVANNIIERTSNGHRYFDIAK